MLTGAPRAPKPSRVDRSPRQSGLGYCTLVLTVSSPVQPRPYHAGQPLTLAHTQTRVTKKHRLGQVEQKAAGGFLNNNYLPNWVIKYSAVRATIEGHGRPKLFLPSYVVFLSPLRSFHLNLLSSSVAKRLVKSRSDFLGDDRPLLLFSSFGSRGS